MTFGSDRFDSHSGGKLRIVLPQNDKNEHTNELAIPLSTSNRRRCGWMVLENPVGWNGGFHKSHTMFENHET